jgi:hypothetical protein
VNPTGRSGAERRSTRSKSKIVVGLCMMAAMMARRSTKRGGHLTFVSGVLCVGLNIRLNVGLCAYSVDLCAAVGVAARAWLGSRRRGREVSRVRESERARDWTVDRHTEQVTQRNGGD